MGPLDGHLPRPARLPLAAGTRQGSGLWRFYNSENLVFVREDFVPPFDAPVWDALTALDDPELDRLAGLLMGRCARKGPREIGFSTLLFGQTYDRKHLYYHRPRTAQRPSADSPEAGPPTGGQVFLSYSRSDASTVEQLAQLLAAAGHDAWIDTTGTVGGQDWTEQIMAAIRASRAVVLIISRESMTSQAVRREVQFADRLGVPIIPLLVEPVELPDWYRFHFELLHRIDARDHAELSRAVREIVAALDRR